MRAIDSFLLLVGSVTRAATLSDVACNGKDAISFVFTSDTTPADAEWNVSGCADGSSATLDPSAINKNGDVFTVSFNPYSTCNVSPDPSQASSYSVDIKVSANKGVMLGGQIVHFSGDTMDLKCTFQDTYTVTSDLGGVDLEGDQLVGDEFTLSLTLTRTQSDYTTPDTSQVVANNLVYHTIEPSATMGVLSDWRIVPSKMTLRKGDAGSGVEFDIFKHDMGSCGYTELDFAVQYDSTSNRYQFAFKAMLLELNTASTYNLVVEVSLCNVASTNSECTGMLSQCGL